MGIETPLLSLQSDNQLQLITLGGCALLEGMHRIIFVIEGSVGDDVGDDV